MKILTAWPCNKKGFTILNPHLGVERRRNIWVAFLLWPSMKPISDFLKEESVRLTLRSIFVKFEFDKSLF